ncbi:MAG: hypothetical protein ACRDMH_16185 [Solirubrobacterales bacterium]
MTKSRLLTAVALSALAVGAVVAVQAFAATTTWSGAGTNDPVFKVSFKRVKTAGHPPKVKDFASKQLHFTCHTTPPQPAFRSNTTIHTPITVHSGNFFASRSFTNGNIKVNYTIDGEFVSKRTATGTYKERRSLVSNPTQYCVSAKEPWKVHKQ